MSSGGGPAVGTADHWSIPVEVGDLDAGFVQDLLDGPEAILVIRKAQNLVEHPRCHRRLADRPSEVDGAAAATRCCGA